MTDDESSVGQTINDGDSHDIHPLLSSSERDFLVRNNGDQVKNQLLEGKEDWVVFLCIMVGSMNSLPQVILSLFMSRVTKMIICSMGTSLRCHGLQSHFQSEMCDCLDELFKVMCFHHLVLLDEIGKVRCDSELE